MSKINASQKILIDKFKELAAADEGNINEQLKAMDSLNKNLFPNGSVIDKNYVSVLTEMLPALLKFIDSENEEGQKSVVLFLVDITSTTIKANTKAIIDAGVIPKLVHLLSSNYRDIVFHALEALVNIALPFQEDVVQAIPAIVPFLKSQDEEIFQLSILFLANVTYWCNSSIPPIFENGGIIQLIEILKSNNYAACREALRCLTNIVDDPDSYEQMIAVGVLPALKVLCDRLFRDDEEGDGSSEHSSQSNDEKKLVKLRAMKFIGNLLHDDEELKKSETIDLKSIVDLVLENNFLPLILNQIANGITSEIKNEAILIIESIISNKIEFLLTLIIEHDIISLLCNTLQDTDITLLVTALTVLDNVTEICDDKEICRQKLRECGDMRRLEKLRKHGNKDIEKFSKRIYGFINHSVTRSLNERNGGHRTSNSSRTASSNPQRQKRQANTQMESPTSTRSKRTRILQAETDSFGGSSNVQNRNGSVAVSSRKLSSNIVGYPETGNETNQNGFEEHHSFSHSTDENDDEMVRSRFAPRKRSPSSDDLDYPSSRPLSHISLMPSEAALMSSGETLSERKYSPIASALNDNNPSRPISHISPALTDAASLSNETIERQFAPRKRSPPGDFDYPSSRPLSRISLMPSEAASVNDGTTLSERKYSPQDDVDDQPLSTISPLLPEAATLSDETIQNERKHIPYSANLNNLSQAAPSLSESTSTPASDNADNLSSNNVSSNGTFQNIVRKQSPPPVALTALPATQTSNETNNQDENDSVIAEYCFPSGYFIKQNCKHFNLKFDNNEYLQFLQKIEFSEIKSTSKPASYFPTNDTTGYSCFSIILSGNDDSKNVELFQKEINKQFHRKNYGVLDSATMESIVFSPTMKEEHIKFVVELLKFRIVLYSDGEWQKFGNFSSEDTPLFLIEKKIVEEDRTSYEVVLTLNQ